MYENNLIGTKNEICTYLDKWECIPKIQDELDNSFHNNRNFQDFHIKVPKIFRQKHPPD